MAPNTQSQLSDSVFNAGMQIACLHKLYGTLRDFVKQKRQKPLLEKKDQKKKKRQKPETKTLARFKNWNHLKSHKHTKKKISRGNSPLTDGFIITNNDKSL